MNQPTPGIGDVLTVAEGAEYLKLSKAMLYRLIRRGDIPSYRLTRDAVRLRRRDLDAFVDAARVESSEHGEASEQT